MKGVVFNLLEELVTRDYGEDTWDALLDAAEVDGAYTTLGSYDDADFGRLVAAASDALETPPDEMVRWFGRNALPLFHRSHPQLFERHSDTRSFVLTLNEIIHPDVRKLYPGADVPVFDFDASADGGLVIGYRSPRKLCSFAEGLLEGAALHFGEELAVDQRQCMKRGDHRCVLEVSFGPLGNAG